VAEDVTLAPVDVGLEATVLAVRPPPCEERFSGLPADTPLAARSRLGASRRDAARRDPGRLDHSGGEGPQHVLVLGLKRR